MATKRFNYLQRFRVALRKIGYTKAEANRIVAKIRKNKDNEGDGYFEHTCEVNRSFAGMLSDSFIWTTSLEGEAYWYDLYTTLRIMGE